MRLLLGLVLAGWLPAQTVQEVGRSESSPPARVNRADGGLIDAAALRNENVQVNLIDNDGLKEANIRLGDNVTLLPEAPVDANYYATEHGRPAGEAPITRRASPLTGWHGELFESLQNSVFNARKFFQVGPVQPSRQNRYGGRFGIAVRRVGDFSGEFSQRKTSGMVNGNVLAPLVTERSPLASDPALRALISRFLAAYPAELPNRLDFDPRALNTNSPQRGNELNGSLKFDRTLWGGHLSASHAINRQAIDAFQLVAGQNPDTRLHEQRSRLGWQEAIRPSTEAQFGMQYTRLRSSLLPEANAVGPRVRFGYQIEELGPDSQFPIDRAQNTWRAGAVLSRKAGGSRHSLTYGADVSRAQLNGIETNNSRGLFWFTSNFGRSAIDNLRWGTPTTYEVTVGEMARGFRNWSSNWFAGDRWSLAPRFQLSYGLRYNLVTSPVEVNGRSTIPYGCDCNNLSPRLALAWRGPGEWVVRAGYTISFADIPAVTYQQARYNMPGAFYLQVQSPDLLHPLTGIDLKAPGLRTSPTALARELVSPYSHQYTLILERRFGRQVGWRLGYTGSRALKLIDTSIQNRATPVAGVPLTTASVDQRRADARFYDVKYVVNGGGAWLNATQTTLDYRLRGGLLWSVTYTLSKAIDSGVDYSATGANNDMAKGRAQSEFDNNADRRGLSNFDSTHSLTTNFSYDLPRLGGALRRYTDGWQISGSLLAKTGTPLTLFVGSDSPGFGNVDGGPGDRPNLLDPSILGMTIGDPDTATAILRKDRFAYITPGEARGNLGRNTFRKGGIFNCNAAVTRRWQWGRKGERALQFRAEAFNLSNRPQFDEPQRNLSSPAFGKITNTLNDGRVLQLGIRMTL
jgi:hypothetical protein